MFDIIRNRNKYFLVSAIVILIGVIAFIGFKGLNQDIDFIGGTTVNINIHNAYDNDEMYSTVKTALGFEASSIQKSGADQTEVIIKTKPLNTVQRSTLFTAIKDKYKLADKDLLQFDNVDASTGNELKSQAFWASLWAMILILLFVSFRFDFKSGVAAILALVHDLLILVTVYTLFRIPVNTAFIAAVLTILGYSIYDTIIVFDRIRENQKFARKETFADLANRSIWQTMTRSVNAITTTLITITVLFFMGVPSIREFAFPLIIGIISGAYSSIFIASPIWVMWRESTGKKKLKKA